MNTKPQKNKNEKPPKKRKRKNTKTQKHESIKIIMFVKNIKFDTKITHLLTDVFKIIRS